MKSEFGKEGFVKRLKRAMELRGFEQVDLVKATGIGKSSISQYLSGDHVPKQVNNFKIAEALNVDPSWLYGANVDMQPLPTNLIPTNFIKVPMLGEIAAGEPIFAFEEQGKYVEVNGDLTVDFCLKIRGDSMIDARIEDGDYVFVRKQCAVENGEIAVVLIDGEATLKRFYKSDGMVILKPENSKYQPRFYTEKDFKSVRVLGKAVMFQSRL